MIWGVCLLGEISTVCAAVLTAILLIIGGYFSYKTNFFQIRKLKFWNSEIIKSVKNDGFEGVKSLFLALGGTVGVGNIAGVATAIKIGGAGSIVWMMLCGFIGMITKYAEVYLAVENAPQGPFAYIKNSLGKFWVKIFSASCIFCSLLIGGVFQTKAVEETFTTVFEFSPFVSFLFVILPVVVLGLSKGEFIKKFSSFTVPFMAVGYIVIILIIIVQNFNLLPLAVSKIFSSFFGIDSAIGGGVGYVILSGIRQGVSKGLFSHEAGIGSSPISYSNCGINAKICGYMGILEVFIDTCVICFLTALALILTGFSSSGGMQAASNMFLFYFGKWGGIFLAVAVYFFSISSIAGWMYYGKSATRELSNSKTAQNIFSILIIFSVPFAFIININTVWNLCDIIMLIMALPNLISVVKNREVIIKSVRDDNDVKFMCRVRQKLPS